MTDVTVDYISVGGNRHPAAADWDRSSGILAFGADNNIALWDPLVRLPVLSAWNMANLPPRMNTTKGFSLYLKGIRIL
jgi:hypothetical protein